jgi:polar amino acid transport system substrate-binding protein
MTEKTDTMRRALVAATLAFGLAGGAALAQEKTTMDPRLTTPGKLTVATGDPVYPPWMMNDAPESGEGFENALIYALAAEMGFAKEDVVWVRTGFDEAITPGPKPYDFNIQQFSVTEQRKEVVGFSQVYFQPDKAVIALPGSPVEAATSYADLRSARWGAALGTTDNDYLVNVLGVTEAAVYDDQAGVFQAMQAGQIDATLAALPTALFVTAVQVPEANIVALLPPDPNDRGHGLLFAKDNPLIPWVDEALSGLIGAGKVQDLKNTWLVANPDLPVISE